MGRRGDGIDLVTRTWWTDRLGLRLRWNRDGNAGKGGEVGFFFKTKLWLVGLLDGIWRFWHRWTALPVSI